MMNKPHVEVNFKDRTSEFFALAERIKKRSNKGSSNTLQRTYTPTPTHAQSNSSRSEFSRMAAQLGRSIAATSEKLEQLTYLTKSQKGTNTKPIEINTLSQSLKSDITKLNNQLKILQSVQKGQKSTSKQANEHTNNVITSLQSKLADTSLGFKDVLEYEVDIQHNGAYETSNTLTAGSSKSSPQPRRRVNVGNNNNSPYHMDQVDNTPQSLGIPMIASQQQLQQQQQLQLIEQHDRGIETRTTAMEAIEGTLAELGGIFQQLATMVAEQRETIQRIDQNTDDIEMNVMGAQSELSKYYQNISTNRSLIIKVFVTVILLFLFFSIVL